MELELARLLIRRTLHRPVLILAWISLCALPWLLAVLGPLGPDARSLFSGRMIYEVAFVWGLVGGVIALTTLAAITISLEPLGTFRRLRAQTGVLAFCILLPAVPIVAPACLPAARDSGGVALAGVLLMTLHVLAIGLVAAQIPAGALRSIAFLSLAWWIPSLVSAPLRGIVVGVLDATRHLESSPGSAAWPAACAPILALVLTAIGVDVIRRPAT
jgi:hypothetical protein